MKPNPWLIIGRFVLVCFIILMAWPAPVQATLLSNNFFLVQTAKLTASDGQSGDRFGYDVAIDGDTTVIGASEQMTQNKAYVRYRNLGGSENWGEKAILNPNDGEAIDFGRYVAIQGDTIAIGAPGAVVGGKSGQGAVYLFERNTGGLDAWGQSKKIAASDGNMYDGFGAVAYDGDTLVSGASSADLIGGTNQGAVYIYYRNQGGANNWGQVRKITASDASDYDQFGYQVAIDGDVLVVGSNGNNNAAYVFYRDQGGSNVWGQVKKLVASDGQNGVYFGSAVSVSGDIITVGASLVDSKGAVYVYQRNAGGPDQWAEVKKITASDGLQYFEPGFGASLALNGSNLLVGAPGADPGGLQDAGEIYLFQRDNGGPDAWGESTKNTSADRAANDFFGSSVALNGQTALAGASEATIAGKVAQGTAYAYSIIPAKIASLPVVFRNLCTIILYSDDFNNPGSGWPVGDDGNSLLGYENGEYRILVRATQYGAGAYPGFQAVNYSVTVDLRNLNAVYGSYGIAFGIASDWSTFYSLEIYPAGAYGIYRYDPSDIVTLSEAYSDSIFLGSTPNRIKVERNGGSIKAYANGHLLASVTDDTYTGARALGLVAFSYDQPNLDIRYDNFTVYPLPCLKSNAPSSLEEDWLLPSIQFDPSR